MAGIRVHDVSKSYSLPDGTERPVLDEIDLSIADGEFVCLLGPSGCGKTTLLNILSGLDRDHRGRVEYDGARRQPRFSYMFQESRLLPWLTVRDNLRFVLDDKEQGEPGRTVIDDWLERVGLATSADDYPSQLSVGMQQRVALVRALIVEPEVLYMDEPLSSLDELTATQMRDELLTLWQEQSPTVVFVTHNPLEAVYLADRVLIMSPRPGSIIGEVRVSGEILRPRNAENARLWELSRECLRILRQEGRGEVPGPIG